MSNIRDLETQAAHWEQTVSRLRGVRLPVHWEQRIRDHKALTATCEAELARVVEKLRSARAAIEASKEQTRAQRSISDCIREQTWKTMESERILVSGAGFEAFDIPSKIYCTGMCDFPMSTFERAKVLDLSDYLIPMVFRAPGNNLMEKVNAYLFDKWNVIRTYDMFKLPIDKHLKSQGKKQHDLPNVSFAVTYFFLQRGIEFVVCDPIHRGTDSTIRVVNYSAVLRDLYSKRIRVQTRAGEPGLKMIMYQRGAGNPDAVTYRQLEAATGLDRTSVMHCHLTPGKFEQGLHGGNCYRDFAKSVSKILHELNLIDPYTIRKRVDRIHTIYFVLDEFSAYAAYTATAIIGYGLTDVASVLAYRQGVYTPMKCEC